MHDHFGDEAGEEEPVEAEGEAEVGPIVSVLKGLEHVAVDLDLVVKVHLVESLHRDRRSPSVLLLIGIALESQVVLDWSARVFCFFCFAG